MLKISDAPAPVMHEQSVAVERISPPEEVSKPVPVAEEAAASQADDISEGFDQIVYTIQRGDNLWKIARRFYCTEKEIMSLNGMRSNLIHEGRTLKIQPGTTTAKDFDPEKIAYSYLVTPKDLSHEEPLAVIAAKFSGEEPHQVITAADITAVNDLGTSPLRVGQHLWITNVTIEGRSASWYGKDFHGKKMANGKIYDMNVISCASRDLPMGTIVKATALHPEKEGRPAYERSISGMPVTDWGPDYDRAVRAIDISRKAASMLDMLEAGVVPVIITIESLPKMPDLPLEA